MPCLVSCSGGLIVIGLIALSIAHINSEIWSNEVSDMQYGRLGSNITLACGTSSPGSRTLVEWRLNRSSALPWHKLTSDGSLVLIHADHTSEGNYSCHDDRGLLIRTTRLRLGHPPGLLSVSCRVPNHSLVQCSWVESVKTHLPAQYHASYSLSRGRTHVKPCVVDSPELRRCTITEPTMWQPRHEINITETNPLGSQTTLIRVKFHELLKPDPPEAVMVVGVEGYLMRLLVDWRYPASWLNDTVPFPLSFQLRYRPVGSSVWSTVDSKSSPLLITDALAGHPHQLQVRAQDDINSDSQWSDWSPLLEAWPWRGTTPEPTEEPILVDLDYNEIDHTATANSKSEDSQAEDHGSLGLVILLSLFAAVILVAVFSLFILMWVRQRRRDSVMKQELTSMVKMKSIPI